ncbi:hypothetical protein IMSAG025_02236 [Muribaculaceae bacterium]|nr:hypothetical protein IMSAG025_02236 [Muribaculaceae bacterium]
MERDRLADTSLDIFGDKRHSVRAYRELGKEILQSDYSHLVRIAEKSRHLYSRCRHISLVNCRSPHKLNLTAER